MQIWYLAIITLIVAQYNGVSVPAWIWAILIIVTFLGTLGITIKAVEAAKENN